MKGQRRTASLLLKATLCLALSVLWLPVGAGAATKDQVNEVRQLLEEYHISKPTDDKLGESGIDAMIDALGDPYTQYFSPEELQSFSNAINQSFVGIGIVMSQDDGIVYLEDVVPDSPAYKAGLMPGDALVSIDGVLTAGKTIDAIQIMAAGTEGTFVNIGVKRGLVKLQFLVTRSAVQLPVATSRLMGSGVGYLRLDSFSADAGAKFKTQLQSLEGKGMSSLVVDLRGNGGGYVDQAQQIAALFVKDGILAHVADRDGKDTPIELHGVSRSYPVYILVDGGSASATELLSGALQEYGIAKLVGTKTYGKGVIQQLIPVESGGTLKVTVQEYKTPGGKKVDKVGLTPDVTVAGGLQQLLTAYRLAGGGDVRLTVGRGALVVNGIRSADAGSVVKKNGVWYVSSRLGAVASEAKLSYDPQAKQIVFAKGEATYRLGASDSHVIVKNGVSYIDVRLLSKWFSNLTWAAVGDGTVTLYDSAA
ncbi:S41 family peptidase [Cohnella hashimotonis]|uniref:S41 family peptidase n=1 Tax=Cohnella hashimotonis TaxID=2826895 RepID=A0ABT6TI21_9BACL|nr:S41 family peptidase [Cohnella hashimotonis]MDI4645609.1 S41 family peptidase [Cohnella hashimotonis]